MEIRLPFKADFKDSMLSEEKTFTSRTKRYGEIGNTFKAFGATFTIIQQFQRKLQDVADNYHKQEGFESPEEFQKVWIELHPRKGWDPEQIVWVHEFKKGLTKTIGQQNLEV